MEKDIFRIDEAKVEERFLSSIRKNSLLLNEALEIELSRAHQERNVVINKRVIELAKSAAEYTSLAIKSGS